MRSPCVYILASKPGGTLYVGVTSDIVRRVWEHKKGEIDGFSRKYGVTTLAYVEPHETMLEAIRREKQIKKWKRAWKVSLIRAGNPDWRDLYGDMVGTASPYGFPLSRE